jgi:tRNA(Ile)-lysidine synthase
MKERFLEYISREKLCESNDPLLVAVSGGLDSVVLLDLLVKCRFEVGVAHCNFMLRDAESDDDENFVRNLAIKYSLPFYSIQFNTENYAEKRGISIQMAARELRYEWFEQVRGEKKYRFIATGHNRNDQVETFFINLTRGTGIRGLSGIDPSNGNLIRPLLFATRDSIEEYALKCKLQHREDSTNKEVKYSRNQIRHLILPELKKLNPRFEETMLENIEKLRDVESVYLHALSRIGKKLLKEMGNYKTISISDLKKLVPLKPYLWEILREFNFSGQQLNDIIGTLDGIPGKVFLSKSHRLIRDRDELIITKLTEKVTDLFYIENENEPLLEPLRLRFNRKIRDSGFSIPRDNDLACLDADKVSFPLILRRWRKGDYFHPLGMDHLKKLSDFFIDNKMSLVEKENCWILAMGRSIVWVVGRRIDHRYRVTEKTTEVIEIELIK